MRLKEKEIWATDHRHDIPSWLYGASDEDLKTSSWSGQQIKRRSITGFTSILTVITNVQSDHSFTWWQCCINAASNQRLKNVLCFICYQTRLTNSGHHADGMKSLKLVTERRYQLQLEETPVRGLFWLEKAETISKKQALLWPQPNPTPNSSLQ